VNRYPCEETTVDVRYGNVRIRLWLDNPNGAHDDGSMAMHAARIVARHIAQMEKDSALFKCKEFCELLAQDEELAVPLAAVQVIEPRGGFDFGHMIYTKPFNE